MNIVLHGDALTELRKLPDECIDVCITSPPYFHQREYGGGELELGQEDRPELYVHKLTEILDEVYRVLKPTGSLWLNIGDKRIKNSLLCVPEEVLVAQRKRGWVIVNKPIWYKTNFMPNSKHRTLSESYEPIYHLAKTSDYYYNLNEIRESPVTSPRLMNKLRSGTGRKRYKDSGGAMPSGGVKPHPLGVNPGDMWPIATHGSGEEHIAPYPEELVRRCLRLTCPVGGIVLDPFCGSGTTLVVAAKNHRQWIGIELVEQYAQRAKERALERQHEEESQIKFPVFGEELFAELDREDKEVGDS